VTETTATRQIARAAGTVMFAFVLSNLVGLVRQVMISNAFGTKEAIDAFYVASRYPDVIFNLIAGGALGSAFLPTFAGFLAKDDRASAWKLASGIINLVVLVLTVTSLLSAIFAPQIIRFILAPQFAPDKQALAAQLLRITLIAPTIFGVSGVVMGILNAHQRFLLSALASSMLWLGYILGLIFFVPSMGIYGLAWGAVLGAFLHLAIQLPDLMRLPERRFVFSFGLENPAVRQVLTLMGPRLFGVAIVQLNFVVNTIIASGQPEGSIAAITYAFMIMTMPQVAIAQSIAIAALPTFSAQAARGEMGEMRASLAATLRSVVLLSLPATLGLILLRTPITAALLQHGEFDAHSTEMVSWALLWYTAGLVGHSIVEILSRAFYAIHDTRTPVTVGSVAMGLNVVFSFWFSWLFVKIGWMPHGGLALANSLATALEAVALFILMRRRLNGIEGMNLLRGFGAAALATLGMALGLMAWINLSGSLNRWLIALGGVMLGGVIYGLGVWALQVPEVKGIVKWVGKKISAR
jgi:putative peptidoglycan lipid II flippase